MLGFSIEEKLAVLRRPGLAMGPKMARIGDLSHKRMNDAEATKVIAAFMGIARDEKQVAAVREAALAGAGAVVGQYPHVVRSELAREFVDVARNAGGPKENPENMQIVRTALRGATAVTDICGAYGPQMPQVVGEIVARGSYKMDGQTFHLDAKLPKIAQVLQDSIRQSESGGPVLGKRGLRVQGQPFNR
ncbi:MAG: hypothetical protein P4M15_07935 [Alphaproteobacteria bacterium]|nr:hypothetical protein [Alphaproteobacteria bacterium]